jgi:nucleotide-binding universal stress UspA family protein
MDVLIYVDDLPTSENTLALAAQWLAHIPARVTLMTVVEPVVRQGLRPLERGQALLAAAAAHLPAGVSGSIVFKLAHGDPVDALCAACEAGAYDLLIVAPAGRGPLGRLLRGSRIGQIAHNVSTSVLVARPVSLAIRRILVGVGSAEHALVDVRVAVRVAHAFHAQVTLLHVVSQVPMMFTGLEHMRLELDAFLDSGLPGVNTLQAARQIVANAGLEPLLHLREGLVRDELVNEAVEGAYDLLIIGAHADEGWLAVLLDDIADHVVRHCPIPTLVVSGVPRWI